MEIIRPQTQAEKRDFRNIEGKDYRKEFEAKLNDFEQQCMRKYIPFCSRCARYEYLDKIDSIVKEQERSQGFVDYSSDAFKNITVDFNKYCDASRFNLLVSAEVYEGKMVDGQKVSVHTGFNEDFKCNVRGCGITVNVPLSVANERKIKK